jgi:phosphoribosylaminoimidazolecarboxamide formyltransferase/IMP cyclohydrolase
MTINVVEKIDDLVKVRHVLVSVSDKSGLDGFIPRLLEINPGVRIFSTGGTYGRINEILGPQAASCLMQVSDFTGQPETQGGLVKTLDFKIYLGLLTETYNDAHQADLERTASVPIDMVVVNLYPFKETICMIRASAKNFIRVASVVDPSDYETILSELQANNGAITLELRYSLAQKAFEHTAVYDRTIADFLVTKSIDDVQGCYT